MSADRTAYSAVAVDASGRSLGDVTASTTFAMTISASGRATARTDGSCDGAVCTATRLGRHTVIGIANVGGALVRGTAAVQVVPEHRRTGVVPGLASIEIRPGAAVIASGEGIGYTAFGFDRDHRPIGDVTGITDFAIGPDGSCAGARCTSTALGSHIVTGSVSFTRFQVSDSADLLVTPRVTGLLLDSDVRAVRIGHPVSFTAYGMDGAGGQVADLTAATSLSMGLAGACSGRTCTPTSAGEHDVVGTVTVSGRTLSSSVRLRVLAAGSEVVIPPNRDPAGGALVSPPFSPPFTPTPPGTSRITGVAVDASSRTVAAGGTVRYAVKGLDERGVPFVDLTPAAVFTVTAPGSCTGSRCTATRAQMYTVTGTVRLPEGTFSGFATLEVLPGPAVTFQLDPPHAITTAGSRVSYRALGFDAFGNRTGPVTTSRLSIGPDGSCAAAACSASVVGPHAVIAIADLEDGTATARGSLLVLATDVVSLRLNPRTAQIRPGQQATYSAMGIDGTGRAVADLTAYTGFSIGPDGSCSVDTCTATQPGPHTITGAVQAAKGTIAGDARLEVISGATAGAAGEVAAIELSPRTAQVDAGARITYLATGLDAAGAPIGDLTDRATFTIAPDGSCDGATCVATAPGPHTVTASVNEVTGIAPGGGGRPSSGAAVSRSVAFREPASVAKGTASAVPSPASAVMSLASTVRTVASSSAAAPFTASAAPFTASAALSVTAGPGSCIVRPDDLTTLTATTHEVSDGTSVRVDGSFFDRFATCAVVVLLDGSPIADRTLIGADGTIVAAGKVSAAPGQRDGSIAVLASDGVALKRVAFRFPTSQGPNWPLSVLVVLAFLAIATLASAERDRRQRRWIGQHVSVSPVTVQGTIATGRDRHDGPSQPLRAVPETDRDTVEPTQEIEP